jgi:hypothetical protein
MYRLPMIRQNTGAIAAAVPSFGSDPLRPVGATVELEWPVEAAIVVRE